MRHLKLTSVSLVALVLTGCANLAPVFDRPEAPIPGAFEGATTAADIGPLYWQNVIVSETLETLIERGLEQNRDLRIAAANVSVAKARYAIADSNRLPTLSLSAQASEGGTFSSDGPTSSQAFADSAAAQIGVTAWELDFFGKLRNQSESAFQSYLATEAGARSTNIAVVAAIMDGYLQLSADQELLELAQRTVGSQQESLNLTTNLMDAGAANELDVRRASAQLNSARSQVAQYEALVQQDLNTLRLLVGGELPADLTRTATLTPLPVATDIEVGVNSSILLQRPDIVAAEARLKAANADIGVARAAYFPSISLTGQAGTASAGLTDLFTGAGATGWNFGPRVSLPIFDGGRRDNNLAVTEASRELALAQYEKTIQTAFRETADALAVANTIDARTEALSQFTQDTEATLFLSEARFREGLDDYLSVLDAQRQDLTGEQQLILARLKKGQNTAALYRALGAWPTDDAQTRFDRGR